MEKKHILITGASSGLGKETAKKLSEEGYIVFAGVRKPEDKEALEALNPNIKVVFIDVTNDESVNCAFETINKETNRLFALINNAGIAVAGPVEFLGVEHIKNQFEINVFAQIRVAQKFLPMMKEADARIINISSMASYGFFPFISPYGASKRALDTFFNALLIEAKMPNLKVISIKPGVVRTPIWDKSISSSRKNLENIPQDGVEKYGDEMEFLGNNAEKNNAKGLLPEDVANLITKVLKTKNPKLSYNIGRDSHFAKFLSILPQRLVNFLVKKGLETRIKRN